MTQKTLLDCCRCAQEFATEHDLSDGMDVGELNVMRVLSHRTRFLEQITILTEASKNKDKECHLLRLVNMLRLVCWMAHEAGLESVFSTAFCLKHETDMKRSFVSRREAMDKAKSLN